MFIVELSNNTLEAIKLLRLFEIPTTSIFIQVTVFILSFIHIPFKQCYIISSGNYSSPKGLRILTAKFSQGTA